MPDKFVVVASALNLRSEPDPTKKNRVATLAQGSEVTKRSESGTAGWWEVEAIVGGTLLTGFVNASLLAPLAAAPVVTAATGIVAAHLKSNHPEARRNSATARPFPISEAGRPPALSGPPAQRPAQLRAIIDWLDVESGARWKAGNNLTFCNIYAYDVAYLAGAYIPRVWWDSDALTILAGGGSVKPLYDDTVTELNANALTGWFEKFGNRFGWQQHFGPEALQTAANAGQLAVIVAHNVDANRSGHIQVVAPEHGVFQAKRDSSGKVINPLQSQAGATNFRYGMLGTAWWADSNRFRRHGLWICAK